MLEFRHCAEILLVWCMEEDWSTYGGIRVQPKWSSKKQLFKVVLYKATIQSGFLQHSYSKWCSTKQLLKVVLYRATTQRGLHKTETCRTECTSKLHEQLNCWYFSTSLTIQCVFMTIRSSPVLRISSSTARFSSSEGYRFEDSILRRETGTLMENPYVTIVILLIKSKCGLDWHV